MTTGKRLILICLTISTCVAGSMRASQTSTAIDAEALAERLTALERSAEESDPEAVRVVVRRFAETMVHARVHVSAARVIQTYTREGWRTRPYFAVNYIRDDYVYTGDLDPRFQDELAKHMHWVSVVKSLPDRQLMFELAIDEATFEELKPQELVSFTCEIAGIIRGGKSVYSRLIEMEGEAAPAGEPGRPDSRER